MAADFRAERCPQATVLVDPKREVYQAFELARGVSSALSPRSVLGAARALAGGHSQGALAGDPWQLGGAFVIDTAGELVFAQRSARSGDHADPAALIEALERCQASD